MFQTRNVVFTLAMTVLLIVSCGPKAASDPTIVTDIQSKLYANAVTKPASIAVAVQNGVVTLSGNVPSSDVALQAMKIANGTPGVRSVNDGMTVNSTAVAGNSAAPSVSGAPATPPPSPDATSPRPPVTTAPMASNSSGQPSTPNTSPAPPPAPQEPAHRQEATATKPPAPEPIIIPAGERVQVRTIDAIDSKTADPGQAYSASLDAPLVHNGRVVIPTGAPVSLVVVTARSAGRIKGQSELEIRASRVEYHGHSYPIDTSVIEQQGKARGKQTAVRTGIGAAAGAVIGALAGGGKGAAIGSAVGGGAGFGYNAFTHGQQVKIPSETVLTFSLQAPLRIQR